MGWVGLGLGMGREFLFLVGLKWQICEKQMYTHVTVIVKQLFCFVKT